MANTASADKISNIIVPKQGDTAPDFSVPDDAGNALTLSSLKGKKVVLYFYPKDDTPGCTVEAKDFACMVDDFAKAQSVVIGVSKDSVKSHAKFKTKYDLSFALASDEDGSVCDSYGVWVEKSMYGKKYMGIERTTFVIDAEGKIARVWNKVKVEGHAAEVLEVIKAL